MDAEFNPPSPMKRSTPDIREDMHTKGAVFLQFEVPLLNRQRETEWRTLEEKGFLVTSRGCLLPYKYYRQSEKGRHDRQGHHRAASFFIREPDHSRQHNEFGWPETEEVSHLCHDGDCCNPLHIVIEPFWQNRRRNFCGYHGHCDCGNEIKCLFRYAKTGSIEHKILTDADEALKALEVLRAKYKFKVIPFSHFRKIDEKSRNRQKRRRKETSQARKRKRVEKRLRSNL